MPYYTSHRNYYPSYTLLGTSYETQLGLQRKEVIWLNKFTPPTHAFMQIEEAREATVRFYVSVMNELEQRCKKAGSTLPKRVKELDESTQTYSYHYYDRAYLSRYTAGNKVGAAVYLTLFHRCENAVREQFAFKLFNADVYFSKRDDPDQLFNQYFGDVVQALLLPLARALPPPDESLEQALNHADPDRWKPVFAQLLARLPADPTGFAAGVYDLGLANDRNPNVSIIYLEAVRQLGALDREATVDLYLHYLYYGLRRYPFRPKPLLKRMLKALFPRPEHLARFEALSEELLRERDLGAAIDGVPGIYLQERKKIELDMGAVQAVRQQHAGTVELLNEYLREAPATAAPAKTPAEPPTKPPPPPKKAAARRAAKPTAATKSPDVSGAAPAPAVTFAAGLHPSAAQQELLRGFAAGAFALPTATVEALARRHGLLRHQLVDGLNDACEALLDDVLIEESDAGYTIYEPHYRKLIA